MKNFGCRKIASAVCPVLLAVLVTACGGGSSGGGNSGGGSSSGGEAVDTPPVEVLNPLVGRWGNNSSGSAELTIDQNGIAVLVNNVREFRTYYAKLDLDNIDLGEVEEGVVSRRFGVRAYAELGPPVSELGVNDSGPPFFIAGYGVETTQLPRTGGEIQVSYRVRTSGVSIAMAKRGPIEPSATASRLGEFVGLWRRDPTVFSSPDVDYSFEIDSSGRITGSFNGVCAIEGQLTAPVTESDTEIPFMDVAYTGCGQATEYTFFPFILDNPPGGDLPERVILLRGLGEDGAVLLNLVADT